jgi:uncharacterized glyoxalase superfamily protein PhnB
MQLKKLTPNIMVEDVNRAVDWYREVLGFEVAATVPQEGPLDWAMLTHDEVVLMFQARASLTDEYPVFQGREVGGALTFYTDVENVQAWYDRLKGQVRIVTEMHDTFYGSREFAFQDCNGYVFTFSEPPAAPES